MENFDSLDALISSGLIATILGLLAKAWHDRKKRPLEREKVLSDASQQNVTDALAISAEYREQLRITREQVKEDARQAEERHRQEIRDARDRSHRDVIALRERLDGIESTNRELTWKVTRLETDGIEKGRRIGKLEENLGQAHTVVVSLMQYIRDHTIDTGSIPVVDYTIFEP